jgi:hypothetical protein
MPKRGDFDVEYDNDAERNLIIIKFIKKNICCLKKKKINLI